MSPEQELQNRASQDEQKQQSGAPGGGQGRIEDVSGSGVYPMSGPDPSGDVEIQAPGEWVRGTQDPGEGEAHGTSEVFGPDELSQEEK